MGVSLGSRSERERRSAVMMPRATLVLSSTSAMDFTLSRRSVCLFGVATETVGVFSVTSSRTRAFDDRDVATLTTLAQFISVVIAAAVDLAGVTDTLLSGAWHGPASASVFDGDDRKAEERFVADVLNPGASGRLETRGRIDHFLKGRGLTHLFQPVFDLTSGKCFAVEALARFSGRPRRTPDVWFADAHAMGVGVELEVVSVKKALAALSQLPLGVALCVNAGPEAMGSDEVRQLVAACDSRRAWSWS